MYAISDKCRSKVLMILIFNLFPIMLFESQNLINSYIEGYITFILFYNSLREIMNLTLSVKALYISELILILYTIARGIFLRMQYPSFPFILFLQFTVAFVTITFPSINNYTEIKFLIHESDMLKKDFGTIISLLPIPLFKFTISPAEIQLYNSEFVTFIEKLSFKTTGEFLTEFISCFSDSIKNNNEIGRCNFFCKEVDYLVMFRKLEQNNGQFYIASIQDLSLVKEIESLKAKEAYKKMFISVINHQLRTPLNGIYYPLNEIKEKYSTAESSELLQVALNSLDSLTALINDTIAFSECENNQMKITPAFYNIRQELLKIEEIFKLDSKEKEIKFSLEIKICNSLIFTDMKKINQMLIILISNAFKYTYKGKVWVQCIEAPNELTIRISDTGIGIKPGEIPIIFNEFGNLRKNISENTASSGFQLSLVKKITALMEGSITVESKFNIGTTFEIKVPAKWRSESLIELVPNEKDISFTHQIATYSSVPHSHQVTSTKIECNNSSLPELKVLVVDDNATNVFVLQKMLENLNIQSDKAFNGQECITKALCRGMKGYDAILMDINMPVMNGFEATQAINGLIKDNKLPRIPIIGVTAQNESSTRDKCIELGMIKCIFKPVTLSELRSALNIAFDSRTCK